MLRVIQAGAEPVNRGTADDGAQRRRRCDVTRPVLILVNPIPRDEHYERVTHTRERSRMRLHGDRLGDRGDVRNVRGRKGVPVTACAEGVKPVGISLDVRALPTDERLERGLDQI